MDGWNESVSSRSIPLLDSKNREIMLSLINRERNDFGERATSIDYRIHRASKYFRRTIRRKIKPRSDSLEYRILWEGGWVEARRQKRDRNHRRTDEPVRRLLHTRRRSLHCGNVRDACNRRSIVHRSYSLARDRMKVKRQNPVPCIVTA